LNAEEGRIRRLKAQQATEREAKLEKRRATAAEEKRRQERIEAEQQEKHRAEYERQEQARGEMKDRQEEQQRLAKEKAAAIAAKKESIDLRRGNSIRERLGSFTKKKSIELLGSDKTQKLPEKNNLSASRRVRGMMTKSRPTSDVPLGKVAPSSNAGAAAWVDAPVSKPPPEEISNARPSKWVDAPVNRPEPQNDGPVVLPQYDAPVSAVNAGERRVVVKCNNSSITLQVTPTTTSRDLINSASVVMSESIDPSGSELVESFTPLGLERPLRNYEHVRDVMNSWDNDTQNSFTIMAAGDGDHKYGLNTKNAPKEQPGDTSVYMYHSQRPRSWDKRWITLRSDGQVSIAKRQGQETLNICHLTDFDIYVPTHRQQTRRIKPPKKLCFAVKSQQKSNLFLNGANFVHFFATSDKVVAEEWYKAVQGWRSWYLVNILGEGQKPKRESISDSPIRPTTSRSRRASIDASPYQLGSFQSLGFDSGEPGFNNSSPGPRATKSAEAFHARKMSSRDRALPPSAFLNKLSKDPDSGVPTTNQRLPSIVKGPTPDELEASTFAPTGLLGRTYSQRQKVQREREISGGRNETMRSVEPPTGLARKTSTRSVRQKPKPLIDLTPQYQEPPQHVRKGRGVAAEPGQQLVDAATGLDLPPGAIIPPNAKAWRRPQAHSPPQESHGRGGQSIDGGRPRPSIDVGRPQFNDNEAFTERGLLARTLSKRAQGAGATGHGVRTGDRNAIGKPMIDLQMGSQFVNGSLLRQVEAHTGGDGPLIDREKRHEENVRIGEGV
jgi:PH domain